MENFIKWLKENLCLIILIVVILISTNKIIDNLEITRIYPQNPNPSPQQFYPLNVRETSVTPTFSQDRKTAHITYALSLSELPKDSKVYLLYRPFKYSEPNAPYINSIKNNEEFKEVELTPLSGLKFSGDFTLSTEHEYEVELLIKGGEISTSSPLERINFETFPESTGPFEMVGSITPYFNGEFSYYIKVANIHNKVEGNKIKELTSTLYYNEEKLFSLNLLEDRFITRTTDTIKSYEYRGQDKIKNVYGDLPKKSLRMEIKLTPIEGEAIINNYYNN